MKKLCNFKIGRGMVLPPGKFVFLLIFFVAMTGNVLMAQPGSGPILSRQAKISIITCGAGPDLYEAFGHTALRIQDQSLALDLVFNYGMFDFNQPNFYGNFARGSMRYMLGVSPADEFLHQYRYYKRSVREQALNLDSAQKQAIINFLNTNLLPENREYFYDYFDNNCSTKIIELLDSALQHKVLWRFSVPDGKVSYRNMIHKATVFQPWGRLGIDIGLGSLIDKPLQGSQLDFLPDYVEADLNRAEILTGQIAMPLVISNSVLFESDVFWGSSHFWMHPAFIFSIFLLISVLLNWKSDKWNVISKTWSSLLLILAGLVGWVVLLIWLFTNHKAAAWNYNLIWANPLFLFVGLFLMVKGSHSKLRKGLFWYLSVALVLWFMVPQELNVNLLPLVAAMLVCFIGRNKAVKSLVQETEMIG